MGDTGGTSMSTRDNGYRIIRLVNGEKLIAKITGSDKKKLFLERPMVIEGVIGTESINPLMAIRKEYLILQNWIEFCKNNIVGVPKEHILTIYSPDDLLTKAYDTQKEREDTGGNDITSLLPEDLGNNDSLSDMICGSLNSENMDISDIVNDIVNGNIQNFKFKYEDMDNTDDEDWSEDMVNKNRSDYGNELDDWSPYIEDYFRNDENPPFSD